jgi:dienelactone hydrolase
MRQELCTICLLLGLTCHVAGAEQTTYKKEAGPHQVETVLYDWLDAARDRTVPVKVYYPKGGKADLPVIVFSHGLGGTREGYVYLGRHWASHGYVSVHLQHKGSDDAVWRDKAAPMQAMREAAAETRNAIDRAGDVGFAIDRLERVSRETPPLGGRLDLSRLGMAGHSFGAHTTLAVAGQTYIPLLGKPKTADPRVKAAIPMSSPVPPRKRGLDAVYQHIGIPCFHMTGTLDSSVIRETDPKERRIPFDHTRGADQYLVTFAGGDHMVFSGHRRRFGDGTKDPLFHDLIRQSTTAFWDAYLKGDTKAMAWFSGGGFERLLGANGVFEKKTKGAALRVDHAPRDPAATEPAAGAAGHVPVR